MIYLRTSEAILHTMFLRFLIHSPYIYQCKMRHLFLSPHTLQMSTLVQELTTSWHWRPAFDFHLYNVGRTPAAYLYFRIRAFVCFFHLPLIPLSLSLPSVFNIQKTFTLKLGGLQLKYKICQLYFLLFVLFPSLSFFRVFYQNSQTILTKGAREQPVTDPFSVRFNEFSCTN